MASSPSSPRTPAGRAGPSTSAGLTVDLAEAAGFTYLQHVVALQAAVRDGDLVARPSFWQTLQLRRAHERGEPAHLVVHEDLEVFLAPSKETARAG